MIHTLPAVTGVLDPWRAVRPGDVLVVRHAGRKVSSRIRVTEVERPTTAVPGLTSRPAFVWGDEITLTGRVRWRGGGAGRGRNSKRMERIVRYLFMHEVIEIIPATA